jgi:hypothetical protein
VHEDWVIDQGVWDGLEEGILAAQRLDGQEYGRLMAAFSENVSLAGQQQAGLYVWYLLRNVVGGIAGGMPSESFLHDISINHTGGFEKVAKADSSLLEDALRKVFELPPKVKDVGPGGLLFLAPAACGVLLADSGYELSVLKEKLNKWWMRSSNNFYNKGLRRLSSLYF